jgi:hypothetical protein
VSVGDPLEKGDASPQPRPEDLEELLPPSSAAELGHRKPLLVNELVARLLAEDEAWSREATEEEVDDGLRVVHDHGAPDDDVKEVEHLSKEITQARTSADDLAVYEGVELSVVVRLVGMAEGTGGDLGDVLGVTQHPVEVKN